MAGFPRLANVVVDTADVRATAEFYRRLLDLVYRDGDEPPTTGPDSADWLVLYTREGRRLLAFQRADDLRETTWPAPDVPMQMHLCFYVDDPDRLDAEADRARDLGATLREHRTVDPDEPLYVLTDPAGHPFCLYTHPSVPRGAHCDGGPAVSSELVCTVVETGDPDALARFWCTALGWRVLERWTDAHGTAFVEVGVDSPRLLFQQSDTARTGGQRLHLDIRPVGATQADEVQRLVAAGAEVVEDDPAVGWVVLRDPDGAVFCVLSPHDRPGTPAGE